MSNIKTPDTHPHHHAIGHHYRAFCCRTNQTQTYLCDSHEFPQGYWMTRVDAPEEHKANQHSQWRKNVSERAIDRTYHHDPKCPHKDCQTVVQDNEEPPISIRGSGNVFKDIGLPDHELLLKRAERDFRRVFDDPDSL